MRLRLLAILVILAALALAATTLPVGVWLVGLRGRIETLGAWGPAAFGVAYVLAVVLMLPGSALTLAAGALFGPLLGTVTVSLASTTGVAVTFGLARLAGRRRVTRLLAGARHLAALDRAVTAEGWKVVALVRLSPVVPFNLQNYLWGLTGVRFGPCVLASWIAMLPATFLYVYVGYLGGAGLEAGAGAGETGLAVWTLRGLGLAATVAVTILLARRARAILARAGQAAPRADSPPTRPPRGWVTALLVFVAAATLAGAIGLRVNPAPARRLVSGWFGPPPVIMAESYARRATGPDVDHAPLDGLLHRHVDATGLVDYAGLAADAAVLEEYLRVLADAPIDAMGRDQRLALLVNAYNAFTLRLILDHDDGGRLASIRDIDRPWARTRWSLGGETVSLDGIEHELIRPHFAEPRVHFALVCAAIGCPPLRREAYTARRLERQLDDQARRVHASPRWFRFEPAAEALALTPLYQWYRGDFEQAAGTITAYAARYSSPLAGMLETGTEPRVSWLDYDWALNRQP